MNSTKEQLETNEVEQSAKEKVSSVKAESKEKRSKLDEELITNVPKSFDKNFLVKIWDKLKNKFDDVWKWLKGLFGEDEKVEESNDDANSAETLNDSDKKAQEALLKDAKSPEEALKLLEESTLVQQQKDKDKIEAKQEIKNGETAKMAIWSKERQEAMVGEVILNDGVPTFKMIGEAGSATYVVQMPEIPLVGKVKVNSVDTTGINSGLIVLKTSVKDVPVKTEKLMMLFSTMAANQKDSIMLKGEDGEVEVKRVNSSLPAIRTLAERRKNPDKVVKSVKTSEKEPTWVDRSIDQVSEWATVATDEASDAIESIKMVPDVFSLYMELRDIVGSDSKLGEIGKLISEAKNTEDVKEQETLLWKVNSTLGYVTGRLKKAIASGLKFPKQFLGIFTELEKQKAQINEISFPDEGIIDSIFGSEDGQKATLSNSFDSVLKLKDEVKVDDSSYLAQIMTSFVNMIDRDFEGELTEVTKDKAKSLMLKYWEEEAWFSVLPESVQKEIVSQAVDWVL